GAGRAPPRRPPGAARPGRARRGGGGWRGRAGPCRRARTGRFRVAPRVRPPNNARRCLSIGSMATLKAGAAVDARSGPARGLPAAVTIVRRATFAAAHVLRREEWDEARNRAVFGACAGDHGHNYVLEVAVSGVPDPATGMV